MIINRNGFIITLIILSMGLLGFQKETPTNQKTSINPYKDSDTNIIYNLLFCDNLDLYKERTIHSKNYPYNILFSKASSLADLQKIIDDRNSDPRVKILSYNRQLALGHKSTKKELLAVIVEVGLNNGLDVLASFYNGTARYINQTGKILVWEMTDETSKKLTNDLFQKSQNIVNKIRPWDKSRLSYPTKGNARITFLVSDGLYFGEASIDILFKDPLASPALTTATELMNYLVEKSSKKNAK